MSDAIQILLYVRKAALGVLLLAVFPALGHAQWSVGLGTTFYNDFKHHADPSAQRKSLAFNRLVFGRTLHHDQYLQFGWGQYDSRSAATTANGPSSQLAVRSLSLGWGSKMRVSFSIQPWFYAGLNLQQYDVYKRWSGDVGETPEPSVSNEEGMSVSLELMLGYRFALAELGAEVEAFVGAIDGLGSGASAMQTSVQLLYRFQGREQEP